MRRPSRLVPRSLLALVPLAAALAGALPASAQLDPLALRFGFGSQQMGGDLGDVLDGAVDAEFSLMVPVGRLRVGGGANWASLKMVDQEASWNKIRFHALVGFPLRLTERFRPYAEARYTFQRLRPEDDRFFGGEERLLRDFVTSGSGFEGVLGTEVTINHSVAVDLSGALGTLSLSPDLSEEGLGPVDSGSTWRLHAGVAWFPLTNR